MRVLITGGTGFIGKAILAAGYPAQFTVLTRNPEAFEKEAPTLASGVQLIRGDIRSVSFPDESFDYIIHGAADADSATRNLPENVRTIVDGTRRLLAWKGARAAKKILYLSSGAAGDDSAYGQAKLNAELLCAEHSTPCVIARCFSFVGPYLPRSSLAVNQFIHDALAGEDVVANDGRPVRSYLHTSELAKWLWTLMQHGSRKGHYEIGSDQAVSIGELALEVASQAKVGCYVGGFKHSGRYVPDVRRMYQEFNLSPQIGLGDAIKHTLNWHESRKPA